MSRLPDLTVKVTFHDGLVMLFGNSYRSWDDQLDEFCGLHSKARVPVGIVASCFPWIGFGGLKWCHPDAFQKELDKEGKGRKAAEMMWIALPAKEQKKLVTIVADAERRIARREIINAEFPPEPADAVA